MAVANNSQAGMPTFSRQNSTTSLSSYTTAFNSTTGAFEPSTPWIETWLPELPLHTLLTLISQLSPILPPSSTSTDTLSPAALKVLRTVQLAGIEPSAIRIQYFEWSPLSLGWYESLLWSFVFLGEMQVQKGTVGVWNGSHIKLFRVEAVASMGPTLSSPRGAVDAVGSNIVSRIGSMNLRGSTEGAGGSGGGSAGTGDRTVDRERDREREREVRTGTGEPGVGTGLGGRSAVI